MFGVEGLGFRGSRIRVQVEGLGLRVYGLGSRF